MPEKVIKVDDVMKIWNKYAAFIKVKDILNLPIYNANIIETKENWSEDLGKLFIDANDD